MNYLKTWEFSVRTVDRSNQFKRDIKKRKNKHHLSETWTN